MTRRILAFVAHALGTLMIGTAPLAWAEKPLVTTTLHPLSLILSGIAGDQVEIRTLIPGNASPHTYQLRPSERQLLDEAALIVWVGPDMETFLDRLMHQPALSSKVLTLWPGAKMPAKDADDHDHDHAAHKPSTDTHAHDEHDEHDHDHGAGQDPHIWLDPALAVQIGEQMHARLRTLKGVDGDRLDANLAQFRTRLNETDGRLSGQLASLKGIGLFTYHDAFSRFTEHYGLRVAGILTGSPEKTPGAKHLNDIKQRLQKEKHACLLKEPQFELRWWGALAQGLPVSVVEWDPLGHAIPLGADGYMQFLEALGQDALQCLKPAG